ncbi:ras-related protein Rab-22A-like isoform X1 [Tachypleus tridentatus]|uniref:ras-related protein Rab-22A-like isoform X1 n=1 Tax=Tachypleus tridentatus TaxID=6853 RepID=UPI003FD2FBC8
MSKQEVKLCLLGDSGVGKSSIVQRFVNNTFNPLAESTIGASFMTKNVLEDTHTYKFNIWDTAGQERYRALAPMYYRGAGAAIIVYDVTSAQSFESLKGWVRELQHHGPPGIILAIAGNKCDLEDYREVSYQTAKNYADEIGALFVETSALKAVNINEIFQEISKKIPKETVPRLVEHSLQLQPGHKKKKCC